MISACGGTDTVTSVIDARLSQFKPSGISAAVWADTREFYSERHSAPAWVNDDRPTRAALDALATLSTAPAHGLPVPSSLKSLESLYSEIEDAKLDGHERAMSLARLDVGITAALLELGRDVALGHSTPSSLDGRWKARREAPRFAALLQEASRDVGTWLRRVQPPHAGYASLMSALKRLRDQETRGGWPAVPGRAFAPGQTGPAVAALKRRLAAGEHLTSGRDVDAYDADVKQAVMQFQDRHGIPASGVADAATVAALNVPLADRIRQVELNLERWRWLPDDLGDHHLWVNLPEFHLVARERSTDVMDIRVVVGSPGNETPVFSGEMTTVVFSPYWNIPDSIVAGETAPAAARDDDFLRRNNIEILRVSTSGAARIDSSEVDWNDTEALKELAFRQRPGASNALGHVKFLFPNPHSIYLHDTPADNLFGRRSRALSHGCIRVEEPEALAKYVLRHQAEWTEAKIVAAMRSGTERAVPLQRRLPVHLVYFTAFARDDGMPRFRPDIYGHDRRQKRT